MKLNAFALMKEQFDHTGMVFNEKNAQTMALNRTGVLLWKLLASGAGLERLVSALQSEYPDVPAEQLENDVETFLQELENRSLLSRQ